MKHIFFGILSLFLASNLWAAPVKHSKLEISTSSKAGQPVKSTFKIVPGEAMVINDGKDPNKKDDMVPPWELSIREPSGISFESNTLEYAKYDKAIPGFSLESKSKVEKAWTYHFKMIAFVCTKKKENCYRDVFYGECKADAAAVACKETDGPKPTAKK